MDYFYLNFQNFDCTYMEFLKWLSDADSNAEIVMFHFRFLSYSKRNKQRKKNS
jgi:hypothetical protein